jgi:hypothetical protein
MLLLNGPYGLYYRCARYPFCEGSHSAYPDGSPKGKPVRAEVKLFRQETYEIFSGLWKLSPPIMTKEEAYVFMATVLRLPRDKADIGLLSTDQCNELQAYIAIVAKARQEHAFMKQAAEKLESKYRLSTSASSIRDGGRGGADEQYWWEPVIAEVTQIDCPRLFLREVDD